MAFFDRWRRLSSNSPNPLAGASPDEVVGCGMRLRARNSRDSVRRIAHALATVEGKFPVRAERRLKLNREFRRVFARGRSKATERLVLYWWEKRRGGFRVGFSVSRKVGNAVVRNRLKRQLRACFDRYATTLTLHNVDFVVVCRPAAAGCTFSQLDADLVKLLKKGKFMV